MDKMYCRRYLHGDGKAVDHISNLLLIFLLRIMEFSCPIHSSKSLQLVSVSHSIPRICIKYVEIVDDRERVQIDTHIIIGSIEHSFDNENQVEFVTIHSGVKDRTKVDWSCAYEILSRDLKYLSFDLFLSSTRVK